MGALEVTRPTGGVGRQEWLLGALDVTIGLQEE